MGGAGSRFSQRAYGQNCCRSDGARPSARALLRCNGGSPRRGRRWSFFGDGSIVAGAPITRGLSTGGNCEQKYPNSGCRRCLSDHCFLWLQVPFHPNPRSFNSRVAPSDRSTKSHPCPSAGPGSEAVNSAVRRLAEVASFARHGEHALRQRAVLCLIQTGPLPSPGQHISGGDSRRCGEPGHLHRAALPIHLRDGARPAWQEKVASCERWFCDGALVRLPPGRNGATIG